VILSAIFLVLEALIGAGLVIFEMVADNPSVARGWWTASHLANTFLMLAWMTLAARAGWDSSRIRLSDSWAWRFAVAGLLLLLAGASGAVAALGNTLFPAETLAGGFSMDFDPASHLLVRLRVWHPVLAVAAALWLLRLAIPLVSDERASVRRWAFWTGGLVEIQGVAGVLNLALLAPAWLQLVHLALADGVWRGAVLLGAGVLGRVGDTDRHIDTTQS
jgi:heme A synthase